MSVDPKTFRRTGTKASSFQFTEEKAIDRSLKTIVVSHFSCVPANSSHKFFYLEWKIFSWPNSCTPGRSTVDKIFTLQTLLQTRREHNCSLWNAYVDGQRRRSARIHNRSSFRARRKRGSRRLVSPSWLHNPQHWKQFIWNHQNKNRHHSELNEELRQIYSTIQHFSEDQDPSLKLLHTLDPPVRRADVDYNWDGREKG